MTILSRWTALAVLLSVLFGVDRATAQTTPQDLKRMTLQELLDIRVTTTRMPEPASSIPAAVFVITQDDIQHSGATSIPEALRLAPGLQVARIDGGTWAIGVRGFADRLSRSVLVLIDGRAVYSPLFAGTYWEVQHTLLSDIERIEVIRGPGGTLWGANAVNGIINIITKSATDTQGLFVTAGAGSRERGLGGLRYGATHGSMAYRAYVDGIDRQPQFHPDGNDFDGWRAVQGGFRADWALARNRGLTLQGDGYSGRLGGRPTLTTSTPPYATTTNRDSPISGGNVLARFTDASRQTGRTLLQVYYDRTNRDEVPVGERRHTFDVDFEQTFSRWTRHTLVWGAGYRVTSGIISAVAPSALVPNQRTDMLFTAFAQEDLVVAPNRVRVVVGAKVEHNDYSGGEVQPSVRFLWTPTPTNTVFAAVTRAVRTPSRVETDYSTASLAAAGTTPVFVRLVPNPAFEPEELVAYEAGYRTQPTDRIYLTASTFFNDLAKQVGADLQTPFVEATPLPVKVVLPVQFANSLEGSSYGAEFTADIRPRVWWRLTAAYSYLTVDISRMPGSTDVSQERRYEDIVPHHTLVFGSSLDLPSGWSLDWQGRHVSNLRAGPVPAYGASTIRLAWRASPRLELAVVGQDLFNARHYEWPLRAGANVELERGLYARMTWRH